MLNSEISFTDLTDVQLIDLLGRNVVSIDDTLVEAWLRDQTVLVTGAGGSIGTELCTQIARFHPREIVVVDWEETNLFWIHQELQRLGQRATPVLLDVRDAVARPRDAGAASAGRRVPRRRVQARGAGRAPSGAGDLHQRPEHARDRDAPAATRASRNSC